MKTHIFNTTLSIALLLLYFVSIIHTTPIDEIAEYRDPSRKTIRPSKDDPRLIKIMSRNLSHHYENGLEKRGGLPSCYSKAKFTNYWIPKQGDKDMLNNGKIVTLTGPATTELKAAKGKEIAKVDKITFEKFQMEGTGLLKSGVMVNLDSGSTFEVLNRKKTPYGLGNNDNNLVPWVSVASNDLKQGTILYVKQLDGKVIYNITVTDAKGVKRSNIMKHNGCVRVDDTGWSFKNCQLDYFVLQYDGYVLLNNEIKGDYITVSENGCKLLNYVTPAVQAWAELLVTTSNGSKSSSGSSSSKSSGKSKSKKTSKNSKSKVSKNSKSKVSKKSKSNVSKKSKSNPSKKTKSKSANKPKCSKS